MATFTLMPRKISHAQFDAILDSIMKLDFDSRERMLKVLSEQQKVARENLLLKEIDEAMADYRSGKYKALSATELIDRLNSL